MIEFETPTSFHELIHCLEDIDAHYVGRRYAYEEYELYDLIFDRYEFTNKTDEEIESEATTYSENKINLEKNAYLCELNAENAKYTHIEQNVSAMETEEKNKIISEYNKRIENLRADAVKRGVASSTALVNAINLIESERSDKANFRSHSASCGNTPF